LCPAYSNVLEEGVDFTATQLHRQEACASELAASVAFGRLSKFAGTLNKGAHIQIEGELRSREYDSKKTDSKQRIWEIKVDSILKLDRAEKSAPEDGEHNDASNEEVAA
jgi:single-stranded DNA-binding protein